MKKILLSAIVMLFAVQLQAQTQTQKNANKYYMKFLNNKAFEVNSNETKNGGFQFWVDCASWEGGKGMVGFVLKSSSINDFIDGLRGIEDKFEEWTNTAKKNHVTDFEKTFDVIMPSVDCYFTLRDCYFDFYRKPEVYFKVTSQEECLAIFSVRDLKASDNKYITHDGIFIAFTSVAEIESFLKTINLDNAKKKAAKEKEKDDLFN